MNSGYFRVWCLLAKYKKKHKLVKTLNNIQTSNTLNLSVTTSLSAEINGVNSSLTSAL